MTPSGLRESLLRVDMVQNLVHTLVRLGSVHWWIPQWGSPVCCGTAPSSGEGFAETRPPVNFLKGSPEHQL